MPPPSDPLAGVERALIDGSNLAYALARPGGSAGPRSGNGHGSGPGSGASPRPVAGIVASIRSAFPPAVRVEVIFDGPGRAEKAASNLFVEHSGRISADRVIVERVEAQLKADGPAGTWGILVVTDDRELRDLVQARGARVAGTMWLGGRLARAAAGVGVGRASRGTSIGQGRPPRAPYSADGGATGGGDARAGARHAPPKRRSR
jgi:hypothetical protein